MRIAILGATSQIAKDLILHFSTFTNNQLVLFARNISGLNRWIDVSSLNGKHSVLHFDEFSGGNYDAIINFIGVGDPKKTKNLEHEILEITRKFDDMAIAYLKKNPNCRYIFLSSGAVFGDSYENPVDEKSDAVLNINELKGYNWYGVSKLYAECLHRSLSNYSIVDIRVFNYFSGNQDIESNFFITDILRAIKNSKVLQVSGSQIIRDYLHPLDFYQLINLVLCARPQNLAVDCYSLSPITKDQILDFMRENYSLETRMASSNFINSTGNKVNYYSNSRQANKIFGYAPTFTSLDCLRIESKKLLERFI
jgi:nucleoside-diphosphate-sugar epimerase